MVLLLIVSFVWAFSFGLIKGRLAGVDSTAVATLRLALALLVFLPFFRKSLLPWRAALRLALIGAVQFGVMYLLYLRAFVYLPAFEIALFTITTPLFVAVLDAALERRWLARHVLAALLSVVGAGVVLWHAAVSSDRLLGVLLVQASNLCFAAGQLAWRRERPKLPAATGDATLFVLPYTGALAVSVIWSLFTTDWLALRLAPSQAVTLVYLGVFASGLCFFWWNLGATRVNAGTLAVFNNAKIPLAVACSLVFFPESTDVPRLLVGGGLMALAVCIAERNQGAPEIP
jgi:drug/metabolite transporter (DMT)-like permease